MAIGLKRSFTPEDCGLTDAACPGSPALCKENPTSLQDYNLLKLRCLSY